jgi:hypothetical protein
LLTAFDLTGTAVVVVSIGVYRTVGRIGLNLWDVGQIVEGMDVHNACSFHWINRLDCKFPVWLQSGKPNILPSFCRTGFANGLQAFPILLRLSVVFRYRRGILSSGQFYSKRKPVRVIALSFSLLRCPVGQS